MRHKHNSYGTAQGHDGLNNLVFGLVVESCSCLIEDEHLGSAIERPGDPDALSLASRQAHTALADWCVHPLGELSNYIFELCAFDHFN